MAILQHITALLLIIALSSSSVVKSPSNSNGNFELLILHNNDMHARFEQTSQMSGACTVADRDAGKCYGGFPRVAHVVKEARRAAVSGQGPPVLYLNAGDTYTGTAWFTLYKWQIAAEFINALHPDAVSLGNHELDNGVAGLTPFIKNITCPVLAANLDLTKIPVLQAEQNLMKSVIFDINGTKIAVIGYLTPDTKFLAIKNDVEYIEEIIAIREEVLRLKKEGINIFIALGHSGFSKDLEIAQKVEDIDLVIGGHTNTFLWNGTAPDLEKPEGPYPTLVKQASGRLVPAAQAYAYTKYLGKLHLVFDSSGEIVNIDGNPILLDNSVLQDPDVLEIVEKYRSDVQKISEVVVGQTSVILDGNSCRLNECNMGNLITDAIVHKYASGYVGDGWTDAPVSIIQGGNIRASVAHIKLPANITNGDLMTVLPFESNVVRVTMNGSIIWKALEYSVEKYNTIRAPGAFLQVSGLKVEYDLNKPPGMRVMSVFIRCGICEVPEYSVLNKSNTYNLLLPSFLSMGGDGYSMFTDKPSTNLPYDELHATTEYVQKLSPIYPTVEGRTILRNAEKSKASHAVPSTLSFVIGTIAVICTL